MIGYFYRSRFRFYLLEVTELFFSVLIHIKNQNRFRKMKPVFQFDINIIYNIYSYSFDTSLVVFFLWCKNGPLVIYDHIWSKLPHRRRFEVELRSVKDSIYILVTPLFHIGGRRVEDDPHRIHHHQTHRLACWICSSMLYSYVLSWRYFRSKS